MKLYTTSAKTSRKSLHNSTLKISVLRNFVCSVFLLVSSLSFSQDNFSGFIHPEVSLSIKTESPWSYSFGISKKDLAYSNYENRGRFKNKFKFEGEYIELSHYTNRKIGTQGKVSAGIRYRFKETFTGKKDETRLVQQYAYSKYINRNKIEHRVRISQRFRERTSFRARYRFKMEFPLQKVDTTRNELSLITSTEAVLEFGKKEKPTLRQRFSAQVSYELFKNTWLDLGLEYRYREYNIKPNVELNLISAVKISI
ncbi:DUF2490 domain-containing protein [Mesonia ostreae]|uniref:DUF2490 domain-containing protein n=1 Tax=Mesonia ostreae TaxID=861110 RepID=A0ABU2KHG2_9FLAO|nr:DUF2490 domain-containing protein [Mesonia ostreae]MDT0294152.1 DUF2490 domain-containing protein [Mesonia ostreae]